MSRGRPAFGRRLAGALFLLALGGCSGSEVRPVANDPLLGPGAGTPVSRNVPAAGGPASSGVTLTATTGPAAATTEAQGLPAPTRPRVTAADLAAGVEQTLDPAPPLRIGPAPMPKPGDLAPSNGQGTTLQAPIPIRETRASSPPPASDQWAPSPPTTGPAGRPAANTLQQLLDGLKQNGITTHGPDKTATGDYQFLCLVPDKQDPKKFYRYEATEAGDPVNSVKAVQDKMKSDGR